MSDRCASSRGRRRPFIIGGAFSIAFYVLLIGYSADVGHMLGDPGSRETRYGAIAVYLVRFYLRDVGNNTTQGPCRALLADLPGKDHRTWVDNACFSLSMVLAYWAIYLALLPVILIVGIAYFSSTSLQHVASVVPASNLLFLLM